MEGALSPYSVPSKADRAGVNRRLVSFTRSGLATSELALKFCPRDLAVVQTSCRCFIILRLAQPPVARFIYRAPPRPQAAPADGAFTLGKRFFRPKRRRSHSKKKGRQREPAASPEDQHLRRGVFF